MNILLLFRFTNGFMRYIALAIGFICVVVLIYHFIKELYMQSKVIHHRWVKADNYTKFNKAYKCSVCGCNKSYSSHLYRTVFEIYGRLYTTKAPRCKYPLNNITKA